MAALLLAVSACGARGVEVVDDDQLEQAINDVLTAEETKPLKDLAGGDWDQVQVFHAEAASRDRIERTLGERVEMPEIFFLSKDSLLFFRKGGKVVRAVKVAATPFGEGGYPADVLVDGRPKPPGR
ncbi:hypothetical protein JOF53_003060 [Crossiella equi]|uniref:Lipoprotein n=1 Tax=Crossiella equi TaxID=130796 RepID=A0ABS5AC81_9PSEU|nr:hypothetical protein [Crossiella equi]MBP2474188.1 hypothetical protein [Crossiella equi]